MAKRGKLGFGDMILGKRESGHEFCSHFTNSSHSILFLPSHNAGSITHSLIHTAASSLYSCFGSFSPGFFPSFFHSLLETVPPVPLAPTAARSESRSVPGCPSPLRRSNSNLQTYNGPAWFVALKHNRKTDTSLVFRCFTPQMPVITKSLTWHVAR